jgi:NADPH:quinone reductase-like Zn-dependent oxidoreductase
MIPLGLGERRRDTSVTSNQNHFPIITQLQSLQTLFSGRPRIPPINAALMAHAKMSPVCGLNWRIVASLLLPAALRVQFVSAAQSHSPVNRVGSQMSCSIILKGSGKVLPVAFTNPTSVTRGWRSLVSGGRLAACVTSPQGRRRMSMTAATYRAIRVLKHGSADVLRVCSLPRAPLPDSASVRISIKNVGVNFHDTYTRSGLYPNSLPFTNGCEGAGVVTELGSDVKDLSVGDRVAFFEYNCAYASEAIVRRSSVFKLPDNLSFALGAAVLVQGLTAHYLATSSFPLGQSDTCLVHAAGGGTGGLLVQMAKLRGARVIATASAGAKTEAALAAGADHVISYDHDYSFLPRLFELCPQGVDCVYDSIGAATCEVRVCVVSCSRGERAYTWCVFDTRTNTYAHARDLVNMYCYNQ